MSSIIQRTTAGHGIHAHWFFIYGIYTYIITHYHWAPVRWQRQRQTFSLVAHKRSRLHPKLTHNVPQHRIRIFFIFHSKRMQPTCGSTINDRERPNSCWKTVGMCACACPFTDQTTQLKDAADGNLSNSLCRRGWLIKSVCSLSYMFISITAISGPVTSMLFWQCFTHTDTKRIE